jgi:hypothetical protein
MKWIQAAIWIAVILCCGIAKADNGQKVIAVADSYLGVREKTGHNDGKMVTEFVVEGGGLDNEKQIKRTGTGYPWCLSFAIYCWRKAVHPSPYPRMARVQTFWEYANDHELKYKTFDFEEARPKAGDIGCFSHHPDKRSWDGHAVLATGNNTAWDFETDEGNTNAAGSREGDGVYKKRRKPHNSTLELKGFVRPR